MSSFPDYYVFIILSLDRKRSIGVSTTMSFSLNLPPSVVAKKTKTEEQDEPKKKSREDWRKQKELEEMRKAGTAPAMTDEEGK